MDAVHTPAVTLSWKNIRVRVRQEHQGGGTSWASWTSSLSRPEKPLLGWRAAREKVLIDGGA